MISQSDKTLLNGLEAGTLPAGGFGHRQHVQAAWTMLCLDPPDRARQRFRAGLRRFAERRGAPGLYHETITSAFLFAINERMRRLPEDHGWESFAAANSTLVADGEGFLASYYSPDRLAGELARRHFLLPDRSGAR